MSQENVEIVERLIAGFNRRDDDWHAVLGELEPDVEINDLDITLDTETFRGHDGCREWIAAWGDAWGDWRIEDLEVRLLGDDRAIALFLMVVRGKESRIEPSGNLAHNVGGRGASRDSCSCPSASTAPCLRRSRSQVRRSTACSSFARACERRHDCIDLRREARA